MLFNFQLRALADVLPWKSTSGELHLHWFGLTDGWYWLQVDENNALFRYSAEILAHWRERDPEKTIALPYVDYYVVRLWEDVLNMLSTILEPLPSALAQRLETEEGISQWLRQTERWREEQWGEESEIDDETQETYLRALSWWDDRRLDTGYLIAQPQIWFWNDGASIQCFWDNSRTCIDGIPVWEAQRGRIQLTSIRFLEEVHAFHTRLFLAMEERIREAQSSWPHPDVALDMVALEKEQQDRVRWLATRLEQAASRSPTPWNAVIEAITALEKRST